MYNKISFGGYKIFKTEQELNLNKITILFGKNNSGKSSILGLPLLISNSFDADGNEVVTADFRQRTLFAEHKDLVFGRANRAIDVAISNDDYRLEYSFYVDETEDVKSQMENWCLRDKENIIFQWKNQDHKSEKYPFHGIVPINAPEETKRIVKSLNQYVDYIGNVRYNVVRDLRIGTLSEFSGWEGEKCYDYLLKDALTTSNELIEKVSNWYQKTFPGWSLGVDASTQPVFHVLMKNGETNVNAADTGFGIRQSLPIVIRANRPCSQQTLIILEEPEAHLHPAAHGNLGELFVESAINDPNKSYLIETHSFNLILRIRSLIAEGRLSPNNVSLYYVDYDVNDMCSRLKSVAIDKEGNVDGWPLGVFEETYDEVVNIRNHQKYIE